MSCHVVVARYVGPMSLAICLFLPCCLLGCIIYHVVVVLSFPILTQRFRGLDWKVGVGKGGQYRGSRRGRRFFLLVVALVLSFSAPGLAMCCLPPPLQLTPRIENILKLVESVDGTAG